MCDSVLNCLVFHYRIFWIKPCLSNNLKMIVKAYRVYVHIRYKCWQHAQDICWQAARSSCSSTNLWFCARSPLDWIHIIGSCWIFNVFALLRKGFSLLLSAASKISVAQLPRIGTMLYWSLDGILKTKFCGMLSGQHMESRAFLHTYSCYTSLSLKTVILI